MKHSIRFSSMIGGLSVLALLLTTGCQTMTAIHDPDKVTLQTRLEWQTPPAQMALGTAIPQNMTVFLRVKNSAASPITGLRERLARELQAAGYRLVDTRDNAHYTLTADIRYFGETREKDGYKGLLTGAALGGVSGAVIGNNVGDNQNEAVGAAAGAVLGGLVGDAMANRNKIVTYSIAVDVLIGERMDQAVGTTRTTASPGPGQPHAPRHRPLPASGVHQRVETQEDFLYHPSRVAASATKMNLSVYEAGDALTMRVASAVAGAMP